MKFFCETTMSRKWLLFLFYLLVPLLFVVQLTVARGILRVNEAATRINFQKEPVEVQLTIENSSGETLNSRVQLELLDPYDQIVARGDRIVALTAGSQTLLVSLPFYVSRLSAN